MSIKSLSPHYKIIPFVSPLTGLKSTSFRLEIFVYTGAKTNIPQDPVFEITKNNATDTIDNDRINISRLVSDAIEFKIQTSEGPTALLDGKNQAWVKTQVFYITDDPTEEFIPQVVSIDLMSKGYGYGNEGENPGFPASKILMPINEYNVHKDSGHFVVPILLDETGSSINAVDDVFNIFFQNTSLPVLANDNLGFTPTRIISVTLDPGTPATAGTLSVVSGGQLIQYNVGTVEPVNPILATYVIQDSTGARSTGNITINITTVPLVLTAVVDLFTENNEDEVDLDVLINDSLGTLPTNITNISTLDPSVGSVAITPGGQSLTFTPNGVIGQGVFNYTITDSLLNTSNASIFISTILKTVLPNSVFMSAVGSPDKNTSCGLSLDVDRFFDGNNSSPEVGDTIYGDPGLINVFTGGNIYYHTIGNRTLRIDNDGIVLDIQFCF